MFFETVAELKESMEPSDSQEESPGSDPTQSSEVTVVPDGSSNVISNGGEPVLQEQEEDAELDSLELDATLLEKDVQRPDMHLNIQQTADAHGDGNTSCDSGTASIDDSRTPTALYDSAEGSSPAVLEGELECFVSEEPAALPDTILEDVTHNEVSESSPSVLNGTDDFSPICLVTVAAGSLAQSHTSNGPTEPQDTNHRTHLTPTQDPPAPQEEEPPVIANVVSENSIPQNLHSNSNMNPFDTDCSRKLMSEIQRSVSHESLLDELEDELLNNQSEGVRKGSPPNGLPKDQNSMVLFEKCVQYKYSQQEKAIKR